MPWVQNGYPFSEAESYIQMTHNGFEIDELLSCSLFRKSDGVLIGSIGLHDVNWQVPRFEIGYWLRTSATGHGYMTEAVIHLTRLCRDRFEARRMTIRCDSQNLRSRQVAERSGYQFESLTKNDRRSPLDNSLRDMLTFIQIWPD
jgi:ribosomal-protein-serine acetyltransferase